MKKHVVLIVMMFGVSLVLSGCQTDELAHELKTFTVSGLIAEFDPKKNFRKQSFQVSLATLKSTHECSRCYLKGAILSGADLTKANLMGTSLLEADLSNANLQGANLQDAILVRANLRGANLQRAKLYDANLFEANLRHANLNGADLVRSRPQDADLQGANLSGANLRESNLQRANLRGADLRGADLRGAKLQKTNLRLAKLDRKGLALAKAGGAIGLDPVKVAKVVPKKKRKPVKKVAKIVPSLYGNYLSTLPNCKGSPKKYPDPTTGWHNCWGTYSGIDAYVGEWKRGFPYGYGTETLRSGDKYVGEFKFRRYHGQGTFFNSDGSIFKQGVWKTGSFEYAQKVTPKLMAKKKPKPAKQVSKRSPSSSSDSIEKKRKAEEAKIARATPKKSQPPKSTRPKGGSGFFISKSGQVITNAHVVNGCKRITVGDSATKQSPAQLVATDRRNDLALLTLSSLEMASNQTKALIKKLGIQIVPLASEGLLRSEDTQLGERVLVAGFPYGITVSNAIKVSTGIVSSTVGMGDDSGQFQIDAAVQPGNSGGPIYDERGNIVGVVVAQLNKFIMAKATGSLPENVNFGIKASTVRQFLNAKGVPTKWSRKSKPMSTQQLAKIAEKQTLMVMCHQ